MDFTTTTGQPMDLIQKNHLVHEIQQMYKAGQNARNAITPDDEKEWKLTAAGYADGVVVRVRECAKTEGHKLVQLLHGSSVTLAKAENDAYGALVERARVAPENRFVDYKYKSTGHPVRWFPWNPEDHRVVPARLNADPEQEEML